MKLNIVQGLYIVLRANTNSRKIPGFHRGGGGGGCRVGPVTRYNPRPTLNHNYILGIYLKNYSMITPTLKCRKNETITMSYNYDN